MTSRRGLAAGAATLVAAVLVLCGPIGTVLGTFTGGVSAGSNVVTAGRIFPGARTTTAWTVSDGSSGTAAVQSDALSYAGDGQTTKTGAWAAAFASTRYFELAFPSVLAAGVAISGATFDFDFRMAGGSGNACFYFDVRTASTSTVLATYGSAAAPVACNGTTTLNAVSTSIPILTSTTRANDLAVRIYMKNSGGTKTVIIDRATVSGTTPYQAFTLYEGQYVDASNGTAGPTIWPLAANDATTYTSAANWATAFSPTRFLSFTFPAYVPAGATVTAASLSRVYQTVQTNDTICWYMDVLNGTNVIGTHGSSGAPISCSSSNSTSTSDTVTLGEVTSAAIADGIVVELYNDSNKKKKSMDSLISLSVTWALP